MEHRKKRIGIMGGTFDPVHIGHLILGEKAFEQLNLDKVLFMPSGNPPHKKHREGRATDEQRIEMVKRAIKGNDRFEIALTEMDDQGYSYTYHTLEKLNKNNPDTEYYFIIGADSLFAFDTWKSPERICKACILVVAVRDHASADEMRQQIQVVSEKYSGKIILLETQNIDISSNMLREWIKDKKSPRYYIPESVLDYIIENGMYTGDK